MRTRRWSATWSVMAPSRTCSTSGRPAYAGAVSDRPAGPACGVRTGRARSARCSTSSATAAATRPTAIDDTRPALARHPDPRGPGDARCRGQARARRGPRSRPGGRARTGRWSRRPTCWARSDSWDGFEPRHPVLAEIRRRHPHARLGRSGLVMESLVPAIIEQKVTGQEAFAGFRMLVHRFGERAPGPGRERRLWVQPDPETLRTHPVLGVAADAHRPGPLPHRRHRRPVARHRSSGWPPGRRRSSTPRLRSHPRDRRVDQRRGAAAQPRRSRRGVVRRLPRGEGRRLGADRRRPFDDDRLAEFLEPWRPQRGRVPALVAMAGLGRPRRGPRMAPRTHLPAKVSRP